MITTTLIPPEPSVPNPQMTEAQMAAVEVAIRLLRESVLSGRKVDNADVLRLADHATSLMATARTRATLARDFLDAMTRAENCGWGTPEQELMEVARAKLEKNLLGAEIKALMSVRTDDWVQLQDLFAHARFMGRTVVRRALGGVLKFTHVNPVVLKRVLDVVGVELPEEHRASMCVSCGEYEDVNGRCDCCGNMPTCDEFKRPEAPPCTCWACAAKRDGKDPAQVAKEARAARDKR